MRKLLWALVLLCSCGVVAPEPIEEKTTMTRPATFPDWATNANYASGPNVGTPTKIAPSAGRIADGWHNTDVPPAQEENYERNLETQWIRWLAEGNTVAFVDVAGLTNAVADTKVFVKEVGWYRYAGSALYTADGLNVITATGMGVGQWIHESVAEGLLNTLSFPAELDSRTVPSRAYVKGFGWYSYRTPAGSEPTSEWARPATALGSGQWIHESLNLIETVQIPVIGPAPLDATIFPVGTAVGRLNRSIIDHGYFAHQISAPDLAYSFTVTSGTAAAQLTVPTLSAVKLNDIIQFQITASVASNAAAVSQCQIWTEVSENNGSTWIPVTSGNTRPVGVTADNLDHAINLGFAHTMGAAGPVGFIIRVMAASDGVNQIAIHIDSYLATVIRP